MLRLVVVLVLSCVPLLAQAAGPDPRLSRDATVMVRDAVALYGKRGRSALLSQVSDRSNNSFHRNGLFVLVWQRDGTLVAHGLGSKFLGQNLMAVRDAKGMPFIRKSIETGIAGGGWVTYDSWDDPVSQDTSQWAMYVQPAGVDLVIGVGVGPRP
ncbi:MAG: cache domain-containing protein [Pseudomonadota bacterium]